MLQELFPYATTIGYVGSVLVAISLTMNNILRLRVINFFGASTFAFYGFITGAYPVFFLNGFISIIDIYYLFRMRYQKNYFTFNPTLQSNDIFISQFLNYYKNDILSFFPDFNIDRIQNPKLILISRHLNPVGLFVYEILNDGFCKVHLDYACPQYRDFKNFLTLFSEARHLLTDQGLHTMITETHIKAHKSYLKKVGFHEDERNPGRFFEKDFIIQ